MSPQQTDELTKSETSSSNERTQSYADGQKMWRELRENVPPAALRGLPHTTSAQTQKEGEICGYKQNIQFVDRGGQNSKKSTWTSYMETPKSYISYLKACNRIVITLPRWYSFAAEGLTLITSYSWVMMVFGLLECVNARLWFLQILL